MDQKRSVEHYRDHELICEVKPHGSGWTYTIHVLGHKGDNDVLCREECSPGQYHSDIDALAAARTRSRKLVDAIVDSDTPAG